MLRAQAAVEYLIVIAFMTAIVVPIAYFYLYTVDVTTEDVIQSTVANIGHTLSDTAKDVYYSSGYAKRTLELNVPQEVLSITGLRTREVVIELQGRMGEQFFFFPGDVPIAVVVNSSLMHGGNFVIEKRNNVVVICTGQCRCAATETCGNSLDDDCDGQIDDCDNECGTDDDGDGWTAECGIPDCALNNPSIYPVAYDVCGNGINEDCSADGDALC